MGDIRMRGPALERILLKSDRSGNCWLWTGKLNRDGYGELKLNGHHHMAHRVAYEELVGPIGGGLQLDHLCRVRRCVNPSHLEPVTPAENSRRAAEARTHCQSGHPFNEANTYRLNGTRYCRACNREAARRYKARRNATQGGAS